MTAVATKTERREDSAARAFETVPIAVTFGAEIRGLDLTEPLTDDVRAQLRDALDAHKVLVLHDQHGVGPNDLHAFASTFGKPEEAVHPTHPNHADNPGVKVLSTNATKDVRDKVEDSWHTDGATRLQTRCVTVLQAISVPDIGRDTVFADMAAIYESLSEPMKAFLEGKTALYSWGAQMPEAPPVEHPVIAINPNNGERSLYIDKTYTRSIVGLRADESDALLKFFFQLTHMPEFQLRHRWRPGTIAIWNNEMTQHYLVMDREYPRVLHRCMMF